MEENAIVVNPYVRVRGQIPTVDEIRAANAEGVSKIIMDGNLIKKNNWKIKQPRYFKLYNDGIIRYYKKEVEFKVSYP
jgi:hypothetical protein